MVKEDQGRLNQWKPAIQAYLACTSMVDDLIGQIVGALEKSKYADNTIIVFVERPRLSAW